MVKTRFKYSEKARAGLLTRGTSQSRAFGVTQFYVSEIHLLSWGEGSTFSSFVKKPRDGRHRSAVVTESGDPARVGKDLKTL